MEEKFLWCLLENQFENSSLSLKGISGYKLSHVLYWFFSSFLPSLLHVSTVLIGCIMKAKQNSLFFPVLLFVRFLTWPTAPLAWCFTDAHVADTGRLHLMDLFSLTWSPWSVLDRCSWAEAVSESCKKKNTKVCFVSGKEDSMFLNNFLQQVWFIVCFRYCYKCILIVIPIFLQTLTQSFGYCQPLEQQNGVVPDRDAEYRLFDRVVNVRENFSVPVGLRGTIIGIKGGNFFFVIVAL